MTIRFTPKEREAYKKLQAQWVLNSRSEQARCSALGKCALASLGAAIAAGVYLNSFCLGAAVFAVCDWASESWYSQLHN